MKGLLKVLFVTSAFLVTFSIAQAAPINLQGYAWSDLPQTSSVDRGAGWIKFSGPYGGGAGTYQVQMDDTTGVLSGYAWSENYGWLSFQASDVAGCPSGGTCQTTVNLTNGIVQGWARFIAAPTGTTGVWNGWVHFNHSQPNPVTYNITNGQFAGYAWGDSDIGWVKFCGSWSPCVSTVSTIPATINMTSVTPGGASWVVMPDNLTRTGVTTATVNPASGGTVYTIVASTPPAGYTSSISCTNSKTGSSCSATIFPGETVNFTVTYAQAFSYTLNPNSGSVSIEAGQPGSMQMNLVTQGGAAQDVLLSLVSPPSNLSFNWSPSGGNCTPNPNCNVTINMTPGVTMAPGNYTITVRGAPTASNGDATFTLTVTPAQTLTCAAVPSPSSVNVGEPVTWTANVSSGGVGPYTYGTWTLNPNPLDPVNPVGQTAVLPDGYSATGVKTATVTATDTENRTGPCAGSINIGVTPPIFREE